MQNKTSSFRKKLFLSLSTLFCILVGFIAILPWFLSSPSGKEMLLSSLSNQLDGSVSIDTLSLSWKGPQEIVGLRFESLDGKVKLSCDKISCESPLLKALLPSHKIGLVQIQRPDAELRLTLIKEPTTNKPQVHVASLLAEIPLNTYLPIFKVPFIGKLDVQDGKAVIFSENISPITFNLTKGSIRANQNLSEMSVNITGETLQNNIKGSILVDSSFKKTDSHSRSLESKISLIQFPVDGVDQLLALKYPQYRKVLTEAVGPSLDLECSLTFSKEACEAKLTAHSEKILADLQTQLKENELSLTAPATIQISLSPTIVQIAYNKFPELMPLASQSPIQLQTTITRLSIPKTDVGLNFKETSFSSSLELIPYQAVDMNIGCVGKVSSAKLFDKAVADFDLTLTKDNIVSKSKAHISCVNPLTPSKQEITSSIEIGKTPVTFLESLLNSHGNLSKVFGSTINGKVFLEGSLDKLDISSKISSSLLQIEHSHFLWDKQKLSLLEPLNISYLLTPKNLQYFVNPKDVALQNEAEVKATLSKLEVKDFSNPTALKVDALISSSPLNFSKVFSLNNHTIENLSIKLESKSISDISIYLKSNQFSTKFSGGIDRNTDSLFWNKPLQIQYILTNKELKSLYVRAKPPTLLQKTPILIEIEPSRIPLSHITLNQIKLSGHLYGESLLFENANHTHKVKLQNVKAAAQFSGDKDILDFSISSDIEKGKLTSEGKINGLQSPDFFLKADLNLQQFPLDLIDALADSSLSQVLGSVIDLQLSINKRNEMQSISINGNSPLLTIAGGITLTPEAVFLSDPNSPLQLDFHLTKQGYDLITKNFETPFSLVQESQFKADIVELHIPFIGSAYGNPDLSKLLLNVKAENELISLKNTETNTPLNLVNTKLSILKKNEKTPLYVSLDTSSDSEQQGSLHLEAQIKKLLTEQGKFSPSHVQSDLIATFQKFPSDILEVIAPSKEKVIASFLGPYFDMTLKASLHNATGPLSANLTSPNVKFSMEGQLTSGVLSLRQNLLMQVALNPQTSRVLSKKGSSRPIASLSAEHPLLVEISAQGVSVPLFPLIVERIEIPQVQITPGKVFCENKGNLNLMLGILKSKKANQKDQLELWFAPLDIHIHKGVLDLERTEVLVASAYDIALWGRVNFPGNRVNMILGLTAQCLKAAFSIHDLPKDYVLQIPINGTLDNIALDKNAATSKIVALTLWQSKNIPSDSVGGIGGALIGGLLNQVLAPPGNDKPTPKAKTPFPWQQ
jgi:hypothetical protein